MSDDSNTAAEKQTETVTDPEKAARIHIRKSRKKTQRNILKGLLPGVIIMSGLLWSLPLQIATLIFTGVTITAYIAVEGIQHDKTGVFVAIIGGWMGSVTAYMLALLYTMIKPVMQYYILTIGIM